MGLTYNQVRIWGLLMSCPKKISHAHCPFREIRKRSLRERAEIMMQLTEAEMESILHYCDSCHYYYEVGDIDSLNALEVPEILKSHVH